MVPVLHGVAGNTLIEDLEVGSELIEAYFNYHDNCYSFMVFHLELITSAWNDEDVAKALATICVANTKLRRVRMAFVSPLPVMKSLSTREVPLEELQIDPPLVC